MSEATIVSKGDIETILADKGGGRRARARPEAGQIRGWEWNAFAAIMILALGLRLVGLNAPLWYDEVLTLAYFVREPWGQLVTDFSSLNNHMFYSLQAKAVISVVGESAWALRLPALIFGMGSLAVIWLMGRQAAGRGAALIAVLLTAISYHHVWFTQNARGYTGLLFWTTLATLLLVQSLKKPSWKLAVAYGVCVAAGMYTHLSAGFFFLAHGVVYFGAVALDRLKKLPAYPGLRDRRPFFGFLLCGLLTLLLHLPILGQIGGAMGDVSGSVGQGSMNDFKNPLRTLQELVAALGPLGPIAPLAFAGGVGLLGVGAAVMIRRSPLLATIYLMQIPLQLILLMALSFRIWPRYFFIDIGFVFLCVAAGILAAGGWMQPALRRFTYGKGLAAAAVAGAVVVAVAASSVLLLRNYEEPKQDFDGAIATIREDMRPGDVAAAAGLAAEPVRLYFAPDWPTVLNATDLRRLMQPGRRTYVLTAFASNMDQRHPDVAAILNTEFDMIERRGGTLAGGAVKVYRSKGG